VVDHRAKFIFAKGRTFYFSRRVPKALQPRFNKARVITCLHTDSEPQALRAAAQLADRLDALWNQIRLEETALLMLRERSRAVARLPT
jgi:hypothetical protein